MAGRRSAQLLMHYGLGMIIVVLVGGFDDELLVLNIYAI